jgi:predicted permease
VLAAQLSTDIEDPAARVAFYETLFDRLEALPGVASAGATTRVPLREGGAARVVVGGRGEAEAFDVDVRRASRGYFRTLGIPAVRGRSFTAEDRLGSAGVALVNETAERLLWPGETAPGQRVRLARAGESAPWLTVVGVVGDVRHSGFESEPRPELYLSLEQGPPFGPSLVVRTAGDPLALAEPIRRAVHALSPDSVVLDVTSLETTLAASTAPRRWAASILIAFGALAAALAFVGVYATVSHVLTGRRREMAVRMTLGATPLRVLCLALADSILYALPGLALGTALALPGARALGRFLFGVRALDAPTLMLVAAGVTLTVALASFVPALRVARLDPAAVLRAG